MNDAPPPGMDQYVANNSAPTPDMASQQQSSPASVAPPPGMSQYVADEALQRQYGTPGQQALTAVEGAGRGLSFGATDWMAKKLNEIDPSLAPSPEQMAMRREANPATEAISSGLGGGLGLSKLGIGAFGRAVAGSSKVAQLGAAATEGALLQGGNLISDKALGDTDLTGQKIAAQLGAGALLGLGFGAIGMGAESALGKLGVAKGSASEAIQSEIQYQNSSAITKDAIEDTEKPLTKEAKAVSAANSLGLPNEPGMFSDNEFIQKANDALVNGAPTYAGIRRASMFSDAYDKALQLVNDVVPDVEQAPSKADTGAMLQDSLANKIQTESAPISELYNTIKPIAKEIPVSSGALTKIVNTVGDAERVQADPDAERLLSNFEKTSQKGIFQTVDGIKSLRKVIGDSLSPTASPNQRYVVSELQSQLKDLEDKSIMDHAKLLASNATPEVSQKISSLIDQKQQADALYKPFINKVKTLAEYLGKKNISGAQGAVNFIQNELEPEQIADRLFKKGQSKFLDFFSKNFPEEMETVRQYQKQSLREAASKTGEFSPIKFFNQVNKMEPEYQKALFNPDELKTMKGVEEYLRGFPKDFNPSGTSGMQAFREFFKSPLEATVANVRDFGIDQFIKLAGKMPEDMQPDPIQLGATLGDKFNSLNAARAMSDRADQRMGSLIHDIFFSGTQQLTKFMTVGEPEQKNQSYDDRVKRLKLLSTDGPTMEAHMQTHLQGLDQHLPNVSQGIASNISNVTGFLSSKIPKPNANVPLPIHAEWEPSPAMKQKFDRYFDTTNDPIGVLSKIKDGSLMNADMEALTATSPNLLRDMQNKLSPYLSAEQADSLPSKTKSALAKFMNQPLTVQTLPPVIMANQGIFSGIEQAQAIQQGGGMRSKKANGSTLGGLSKLNLAERATTQTERSESVLKD